MRQSRYLQNLAPLMLALLPCLSEPALAHSRNGDQSCSDAIVSAVTKDGGENGKHDSRSICKLWSYQPNTMIATVAYIDGDIEDGRYTIHIALIDTRSGAIKGSTEVDIENDGVAKFDLRDTDAMTIDTGRYDLADGQRAFGLRLHTGTLPTCAEGKETNFLYLFLPQRNTLRAVLKGLPTRYSRLYKGDTCGTGGNAPEFDNFDFSLAISPHSSHGLSDLTLSTVSMPLKHRFSYSLHYNGKEYPIQGFSQKFYDKFL